MDKTYDVVMTKTAENDLNEIILYIAQDNIQIALNIFERLQKRVLSLKHFPEKGRVVPELKDQNIVEYREIIETPWRVFYKIGEEKVFVLNIIDGRRNVQDILMTKLMNS